MSSQIFRTKKNNFSIDYTTIIGGEYKIKFYRIHEIPSMQNVSQKDFKGLVLQQMLTSADEGWDIGQQGVHSDSKFVLQNQPVDAYFESWQLY